MDILKSQSRDTATTPITLESLKKAKINQIELPTTFDRNPSKITESAKLYEKDFKKILQISSIAMQQTPQGLH